ncbi:putative phenylalanine--tRNA ligase [Rosa chinensis]|uniref:Putative phenylalanine--tRNA ligase n=1 Tax=Rosa chinensis TaxID=74649 RepID=A0A2P6PCB4_ROSCH|nr:putative phenylalanine--tRNA ligase [Rosa chinensis]
MLKVRKQVKDILIQMGREEMATNNYVDSSFWKFDALFQPQQHPARHSHDTFFLKTPSTTRKLPEDYVECMSVVVLTFESRGYGCDWKSFTPKKYFSTDRFHQIEGCICDRGLTLGDLMGVLEDFFSRLGMSKLKFKPAYNPYQSLAWRFSAIWEVGGDWKFWHVQARNVASYGGSGRC